MRILTQSGKIAGLYNAGTFRKIASASKHKLRNPEGWALDESVLKTLENLNCKDIEIYDRDSRKTFTCKVSDYRAYGVPINRGYGAQVVLVIGRWDVR